MCNAAFPEPMLSGKGQGHAMRLVTTVDADDYESGEVAVSAILELELDEHGRRMPLLIDRGWSTNQRWHDVRLSEVEATARVTVGPDEPFEGRTVERMEADYWVYLARIAQEQNLLITASELSELRHDVEFTSKLRVLVESSEVS
jgi:hypothetical protein